MRVRWSVVLLLAAGCEISEPDFVPTLPDRPDVGPADPDAGPADCRDVPGLCDVGFECNRRGECVPRTECTASLPCAPGEECLRPDPTVTSTGTCGVPVSGCTRAERCPVCTSVARCGPELEGFGADLEGRPTFSVACETDRDCGGQVCRAGVCVACERDAECGARLCLEGRCTGRDDCGTSPQCGPFERCSIENRCVPTVECTELADALDVAPGTYTDLVVCDAPHRFRVVRPQREATRFVLTSSSTVDLSVDVEVDGQPLELGLLDLPGLVAFDIPYGTGTSSRTIGLDVRSLSGPAPYTLRVEPLTPPCAADAWSLYGGELALIESNRRLALRLCPSETRGIRLRGEPGESVQFVGEYDAGATFTLPSELRGDACREAKVPPGSLRDRDNCALPRVRGGDEAAYQGGIEADEFGFFAGFADFTAPGEAVLELSSRTVSSGADLDLFVGTVTEARNLACEMATVIDGPEAVVEIGGDDLGGAVCSVSWPEAGPERVLRIPLPGELARVRVEVEQVAGEPAELAAGLLGTCGSAVAEPCQRGFRVARPVSLETFTASDEIDLLLGADRPGVRARVAVRVDLLQEPDNDGCIGAYPPDPARPECRDPDPDDGLNEVVCEVVTAAATNTASITGSASCAPAGWGGGPERFHRLDLTAGERALVSLRGPPDGLLWIADDCERMEDTCVEARATTLRSPRIETVVGSGIAFVAVDGVGRFDEGAWELTVVENPECTSDVECPGGGCDRGRCIPRPENDDCTGPAPLALDGDGRATVRGTLGAARNDFAPRCADTSGPDVVYRLELASPVDQLTARIAESDFDATLLVRFAQCAASSAETCNDDVDPRFDPRPQVTLEDPAAGAYYVIVDAASGEGSFVLEIEAD